MLGAFCEQLRVMHTLSPTDYLLAPHEHVVRIRLFGVVRVGHGIEGPHSQRVLVQNVKIGIVFGLDQASQQLLGGGAQIFLGSYFHASFRKKFPAVLVLEN
jgi:hypothetical protein